ncbi:hypothetical protein OU998_05640 [Brevundimonas sp. SL130]|nr:hypothetical protein [Brevundimonas sp. SL130]WAC60926.1 hypothetical protein OU998_05640 [Brevundimonas sp. SL130]
MADDVATSTHSGHFIAPMGAGSSGVGRPFASTATAIWSPEHKITAVVEVRADAVVGSNDPSMIAKIAARNASDRVNDHCSEE